MTINKKYNYNGDENVKKSYEVIHTCLNCGHETALRMFRDEKHENGQKSYECPKCFVKMVIKQVI